MIRELCLLRHAQAVVNAGENDFNRALTGRGNRDACTVGLWMRREQWLPERVLCSPAVRTQATATKVLGMLGIDAGRITTDPRLYFQGTAQIKAVLATVSSRCQRLLLVGHNPDLEALLLELTGPSDVPAGGQRMPTATLAKLQIRGDWQWLPAGCAHLVSLITAKKIPGTDEKPP